VLSLLFQRAEAPPAPAASCPSLSNHANRNILTPHWKPLSPTSNPLRLKIRPKADTLLTESSEKFAFLQGIPVKFGNFHLHEAVYTLAPYKLLLSASG
jgi:hypothetical protein